MKNIKNKKVSLLLMVFSLGAVSACQVTTPVTVDGAIDPNELQQGLPVGMKTALILQSTYSALTGIPENDNAVSNEFNQVKGLLPSAVAINGISKFQILATVNLATAYCNALVQNAAYATSRDAIFGTEVVQSQPALTTLADPAVRTRLVQNVQKAFWGDGLALNPDADTEASTVQMLTDFYNLIPTSGGCPGGSTLDSCLPNNNTTTRSLVKAVCVSLLASLPVTKF